MTKLNEQVEVAAVEVAAVELAIDTTVRASGRAIGVALFNALLPQREEIGNRIFRTLLLDRIASESNSDGSAPTVYNHAKKLAVDEGRTPDFSRSVGEKIGAVVELDQEAEEKIHAMFDAVVAEAHKLAQEDDLVARQAAADAEAAKAAAKAAKQADREAAKAAKQADREAAKAAKQAQRDAAKAAKLEAAEKAKETKIKAKTEAKETAKKVVEEQPEMKWQLVNKTTNEVVEYAPDRKIGLELKKKRDDSEDIKVVKIPAVA